MNRFWMISCDYCEIKSASFVGYPDLDSAVTAHEASDNPHAVIYFCERQPEPGMQFGRDLHLIATKNICGWNWFAIGGVTNYDKVWRDCPERHKVGNEME